MARMVKRLAVIALLLIVGGYVLVTSGLFSVNVPVRLFSSSSNHEELPHLQLPDGFAIELFASGLHAPRMLKETDRGDILVSLPKAGEVVLLFADSDGDGESDGRLTLLEGLNLPHGIDIYNGWLYIAETDSVGRVRFDAQTRLVEGDYQSIITNLPSGKGHWTRTLAFGPDEQLYLTVGSSCNVCEEKDERRAAMLRYRPDGSGETLIATGLRNSVGFDWNATGELYATDNGRDWLGDDFPPCELNRIVMDGFYGWPYTNGSRVPDPDYGQGREDLIEASISPVHAFRAHNAPLGMRFLSKPLGDNLQSALVALHGSWNRSTKDGYKVVSVNWDEDGEINEQDFLTGFLDDDSVSGRPVDVLQASDGRIYISDDYAGVIYRVSF